MFTFPEIPGRYPVGATTFAVPIDVANNEDRVIGEGRLKHTSGGRPNEPALKLEEVAFTAFYPADIEKSRGTGFRQGMSWIPRPITRMLKGYAHFSKWSFWLINLLTGIAARLLKIPVYANASLLDPEEDNDFIGRAWPLVIFLHGLGGNRTNYSHICARLASQGKVVLAFEHRDGTGPYVEMRSAVPGKKSKTKHNHIQYLHPEDVLWEGKADMPKYPLRQDQLIFRQIEVYLGYTHFKNFMGSSIDKEADELPCGKLHTIDGPWNFDLQRRQDDRDFWNSWLKTGSHPKVQCNEDVCIAGHSFGGATVFTVLCTEPPIFDGHSFPHIPVTHAIALDPWVDPLPLPVPSPIAIARSLEGDRARAPPKLLVINSEHFTLWEEHYDHLEDIVGKWRESVSADDNSGNRQEYATLLTIVRCQHISFSDFGVLVPFGRLARHGRRFLDTICDLSVAFLDGGFEDALKSRKQASGEVEDAKTAQQNHSEKEWKKRLVGDMGDIIIH